MAVIESTVTFAGQTFRVAPDIQRLSGDYNTPPTGQAEITQEKFVSELLNWHWPYVEYRYDPTTHEHYVLWRNRNGDGIGAASTSNGVRFFTHKVCQHDWQITDSIAAYTEWKCTKCGGKRFHDSSG